MQFMWWAGTLDHGDGNNPSCHWSTSKLCMTLGSIDYKSDETVILKNLWKIKGD